jgi:hypothetical protein
MGVPGCSFDDLARPLDALVRRDWSPPERPGIPQQHLCDLCGAVGSLCIFERAHIRPVRVCRPAAPIQKVAGQPQRPGHTLVVTELLELARGLFGFGEPASIVCVGSCSIISSIQISRAR